jgi:putative CocE/NonD family hydrolase
LAARIWLPEDAEENAVPALLEYLPYRKSDGTAVRDALRHPYLAGHGYASIRVDMRGSGDSDGILYDEYLQQEQDDALEVLAWIAGQPWCTGNVGMFGKSWGGFNCLQIAARRPPQLKAIIPMHFTDDRYADDVHYMGGCVLTSQMLAWASIMFAYNASPPDPRFVGDRWREMWIERMEKTPPFVEAWLSHQRRDAYWKHGSVCEDYSAIEIPVYAIGGWADAYNNAVPRLLAGLSGPKKGLIGPWVHDFPETAVPGPAIGFLQESLRWWDYWLKGIETGIMDEPMFRCYLQDSIPPTLDYDERPGRWIAEPSWPSPNITRTTFFLNCDGFANTMGARPEAERPVSILGVQAHGFDGGQWGAYGTPGELALDQRAADGEALDFTSAPLAEAVELLGNPEVELQLAVDRPLALVAVRLCEVAPNGVSKLLSWGLLNLTHRDSHEHPEKLESGRRYHVRVQLNVMGYRIAAGHRLRVAVSPTYFYHAWPSPEPVTLTVFAGEGSCLHLPIRRPRPEDENLAAFQPPETSRPLATEQLRSGEDQKWIRKDVISSEIRMELISDDGCILLCDNGMEAEDFGHEVYSIHEGDPLSAAVHIRRKLEYRRGDWQVRIETDSKMTADADSFHLSNHLEGYEKGNRVFAKSWTTTIPRDYV